MNWNKINCHKHAQTNFSNIYKVNKDAITTELEQTEDVQDKLYAGLDVEKVGQIFEIGHEDPHVKTPGGDYENVLNNLNFIVDKQKSHKL